LLLLVVAVSEAFVVPLSQKNTNAHTTTSLYVVREKGQITAPSSASDEETSAIYDKNVQTTYG
jgi:hypothetical protein